MELVQGLVKGLLDLQSLRTSWTILLGPRDVDGRRGQMVQLTLDGAVQKSIHALLG
jgi:hypothetical protein